MEINSLSFVDKMYPIGSIYMSVNSINPSSLFGGTWVSWGNGRVPIGVNTNDTNYNTVEKTGGSSTHSHNSGKTGTPSTNTTGSTTLTIAQIPSHNHIMKRNLGQAAGTARKGVVDYSISSDSDSIVTSSVGGGSGHTHTMNNHIHTIANGSNIQPYITCYMWKRTA